MTSQPDKPTFHELRWSWASKNNDLRTAYLAMNGRISLTDLLTYITQVAPDTPFDEIKVNFGTITWSRAATAEELEDRATLANDTRQRQEQWERDALQRFIKKYPETVTTVAQTTNRELPS